MNARRLNVGGVRRGLFSIAALCTLALAQVALAQGSDDQYDITIKMEMPGMAMPPMSQRICVKKGASDQDLIPRQDNCRVSDTTRSGARLTFKMTCTGNNPMTGTGEFNLVANGYNGQIRMKGKMEGQDIAMTQTIDARRVGGCTAR
jgi:hypothetical protein